MIKTAIAKDAAVVEEIIYTIDQSILFEEFRNLYALKTGVVTDKLVSLGGTKLKAMYEGLVDIETLLKLHPSKVEDIKIINKVKGDIKAAFIAQSYLKVDGDPDAYLSDYAKTTPANSDFRNLLSALVVDFTGREGASKAEVDAIRESTLKSLATLGQEAEGVFWDSKGKRYSKSGDNLYTPYELDRYKSIEFRKERAKTNHYFDTLKEEKPTNDMVKDYWRIMVENQPEDVIKILVGLTNGDLPFEKFNSDTANDVYDSFRDESYEDEN